MRRALIAGSIVAALAMLAGCGGSGNSNNPVGTAPPPPAQGDSGCTGSCVTASSFLTRDEIGRIIAQAVAEAQAQNARATIAVVDRVGNPLAVYRMTGARATVLITSNRGVRGGLEGLNVPSELAALSKAVTGAYLSSEGNAFSTRTASQIVQQHFNPGESNAPSGPLFGVQFSQLACSDLVQLPAATLGALNVPGARTVGPKPAPLGLSADPGGLPLYKGGTVVGGIGIAADELYTLDPSVVDRDRDLDEAIATAGTFGFAAPVDREGDRITVDAKTFRFNDLEFSDLARDPASAPAFASLTPATGGLIAVPFFFAGTAINEGTVFTNAASGIVADTQDYPGLDAFVLVGTDGQPRFRPRAGTDGGTALTATEVRELLRQAIAVANRARAQIRRPTDSQMRVTVSVVDTNGAVLGVARTRDAPIFGTDVSLQKARAAAFFSGSFAAADLNALPDATYFANSASAPGNISIAGTVRLGSYVTAMREFFALPTLLGDGQFAITPRAIGNIARPFYPDGILGTPHGPLSKPFPEWSPFSVGIQLDLINNQVGQILVAYLTQNPAPIVALRPASEGGGGLGCARNPRLANGIQIFPGASPVFRGDRLVGAVGVSGDGIDQDDMVSFLGVHNAGQQLGSIGHAPPARRSDQLSPRGVRLRYVQCPQGPFLGSTEQNVCEGK